MGVISDRAEISHYYEVVICRFKDVKSLCHWFPVHVIFNQAPHTNLDNNGPQA